MGTNVRYSVKTALGILGAVLLLGSLASCGSYKALDINVLQPGELNLGSGNVQLMFVDRKVIRESDSLSALQLYSALRLRRADAVECFYEGVRDGLRNGVRPVLMVKGLGLSSTYVPDNYKIEPISRQGVKELEKLSGLTHVLSVELCDFGLDENSRLMLDTNLYVRLYDVDGNVVDSFKSSKANESFDVEEDNYATICNFFYNNGIKYAERLTPTWMPEERRVYKGNRILNLGYYYFENDNVDEARRIWNGALAMQPKVAAKAAVNLAWLFEQEGNFTGAKALLEAALKTLQRNNGDDKLSAYIASYIKRLDERVKDETKIMEQL